MLGEKIRVVLSAITLILCFAFLYLVTRYVPPIGDDVLFQFDNAYDFYHNDADTSGFVAGERIDDLPTLFNSLYNLYLNWSGRMTGWAMVPILSFTGEVITSIFQAAVFVAYFFAASCVIFGSARSALKHPVALPLIFLIYIYFSSSVGSLLATTFTAIYILTAMLYLLYIYINNKLLSKNYNSDLKTILLFNILGFITGFTHEMLGAIFIMVIGLRLLYVWIIEKRINFVIILKHNIGLAVGYLLCFFAPGNFVRADSDHDVGILTSYSERLYTSVMAHINVFKTYSDFGLFLQFIILLFVAISLIVIIKNRFFSSWLKANFEYIVVCAVSPFIWGFVSYAPHYGLNHWCALVFIIEARCIYTAICLLKPQQFSTLRTIYSCISGLSVAALAVFLALQIPWISDLATVTIQREELIAQAVADGKDTVEVPLYTPSAVNLFTFNGYNNIPDEFKTDYYIKYYGIEVIPTE